MSLLSTERQFSFYAKRNLGDFRDGYLQVVQFLLYALHDLRHVLDRVLLGDASPYPPVPLDHVVHVQPALDDFVQCKVEIGQRVAGNLLPQVVDNECVDLAVIVSGSVAARISEVTTR